MTSIPVPQNSSPSDPTLNKLLEVDADLAAQEAELQAQLQTLQEKRKSLQTVLGLFAPQEQTATLDAAPALALSNGQAPEQEEAVSVTPETAPEPAEAPAAEGQEVAPAPRRRRSASAKQQSKTTKRGQSKQKAPSQKGGRGESWRPYVREEFPTGAPLAELAAAVMQRLPERSFSVPEIMGAIFTEGIPRDQYDTAKGRLFTVLSNGVKENKWVRYDKGQYSAPTGAGVKEGAA